MSDQRIIYTEEMVGASHPTKSDTLNRHGIVEHENDGSHDSFALSTLASPDTITISSGDADLSGVTRDSIGGLYKIDTEGATSTDDLDSISGLSTGDIVILTNANDAREVVVKNGTNIVLQGIDFTLSKSNYDFICLYCIDGTICVEWWRASNS